MILYRRGHRKIGEIDGVSGSMVFHVGVERLSVVSIEEQG